MSVPRSDGQLSFTSVPFLADALIEPGSPYRLFHEKVLPALWQLRPELVKLYCADNGRPGIEPVVMAGVTLLQFMEKAPDRVAVQRVRLNLGWKYALGLDVCDEGFDSSSLVNFRDRLVKAGQQRLLFEGIQQTLEAAGLVKRGGRQRLDSTHVLGNLARMSRLEVVRETLRLVLEQIEKQQPGEPMPGWEELLERYCHSEVAWHKLDKEQLKDRFQQAGQDAWSVLQWVKESGGLAAANEKVALLERVFAEQFTVEPAGPRVKDSEGAGAVKNPHDPDAQWARKDNEGSQCWTGFKAQVMETVPEDTQPKAQGEPTEQFITEVVTTEATASDLEGLELVQAARQAGGRPMPTELHVDAAYVTGDTLHQAEQQQRELVGPARPGHECEGVLSVELFDVDLANRRATCPAGRFSTQCSLKNDRYHGRRIYEFEWGAQCESCSLQPQCTQSRTGRRRLCVGEHHDLIQARRRLAQTEPYQQRMKSRRAIEGTISELVRLGLRRTRYRGLAKTALANFLCAAAVNIGRWLRRLAWEQKRSPAPALA